jgi:ankyrin repeat domain-containing protein 17
MKTLASGNHGTDILRTLLNHGADVNIGCPLDDACYNGHIDMARALIDAKADVSPRGLHKLYQPLCTAARRQHQDIVDLLISHNADIHSLPEGSALLVRAAEGGCVSLIKKLLDSERPYEANLDKALCMAAEKGRTDAVQLLHEYADVKSLESQEFGMSPLMWALYGGHVDTAHALRALGADSSKGGGSGRTMLMYAAIGGCVDLVSTFLREGADVNAKDALSRTALTYAADPDTVRVLLEAKAEVSLDSGVSALLEACCKGALSAVEMLIEARADVNQKTPLTPLESVIFGTMMDGEGDRVGVVSTLLDAKASLGDSSTSYKLLHDCCGKCEDTMPKVARLLLDRDASMLNARDGEGRNALILAVQRDNVEMVEFLINQGIDVNCVDNEGKNAIMHLFSQFRNQVAKVENPLLYTLKLLLRTGVHVNARDKKGKTALFHVIIGSARLSKRRWCGSLRVLLMAGLDPSICCDRGTTIIMTKSRVT